MKFQHALAALALAAVVGWGAYSIFGDHRFGFKEEVQLSNGEVIEVQRTFQAKPFGELGGPGGWEATFNDFVISSPARADNPPAWQSEAGLVPLLFDRDSDTGEWFLVATFYSCEAWYALNRPKLPYAEFRARNGRWQPVALTRRWIGREANVLTTISSQKELSRHTLATKRERMSDTRIAPEYTKIVDHWTTGC
jgi:hypothetical protein